MNLDNLQDYFCGIKIDSEKNTITYLVDQYFDEILDFLKVHVTNFKHGLDENKESVVILKSESGDHEIKFKGINPDNIFIFNSDTNPWRIYLSHNSDNRVEYVTGLRKGIKFGGKL